MEDEDFIIFDNEEDKMNTSKNKWTSVIVPITLIFIALFLVAILIVVCNGKDRSEIGGNTKSIDDIPLTYQQIRVYREADTLWKYKGDAAIASEGNLVIVKDSAGRYHRFANAYVSAHELDRNSSSLDGVYNEDTNKPDVSEKSKVSSNASEEPSSVPEELSSVPEESSKTETSQVSTTSDVSRTSTASR